MKKPSPTQLLEFLHIPFTQADGGDELCMTCLACGKEKHLYMNSETGRYLCMKCGVAGRDHVRFLLDHVIEKSFGEPEGDHYWNKRGLTADTISKFRLGYSPEMHRYVIPYPDRNNIAFRDDGSIKAYDRHKYVRIPGLPSTPFIVGEENASLVVIVEGEVDAISIYQDLTTQESSGEMGVLVVGIPGAQSLSRVWGEVVRRIPSGAKVVSLIHPDTAGQAFRRRLLEKVPGLISGSAPEPYKDANDLLVHVGPGAVSRWVYDLLGGDVDTQGSSGNLGEDREGLTLLPMRSSDYIALPQEGASWLVQDMLVARALGFCAGIPKAMKSMFTLHLAYHIAEGKPFLTKAIEQPGPVLLVQEEDDDNVIQNRLKAIGEPSKNLWVWTPRVTKAHFRLDDDTMIEALDNVLQRLTPVLVVLDPLTNMHLVDENDAGGINRLLERLRYLRDLRKCSFLVVHHMRKESMNGDSHHGQRMRGSSVFHAKSESSLYLERYGSNISVVVENKIRPSRVLECRYTDKGFVLEGEHGVGVE